MESEEELMKLARKRAQDKKWFYIHFCIYVVVNLGLIVQWWVLGGGWPWFITTLLPWGIGLVAHGASVFLGAGTTDKMAEREYEKLKKGKE